MTRTTSGGLDYKGAGIFLGIIAVVALFVGWVQRTIDPRPSKRAEWRRQRNARMLAKKKAARAARALNGSTR